jgi:esterase/lipase superfamily enzyme
MRGPRSVLRLSTSPSAAGQPTFHDEEPAKLMSHQGAEVIIDLSSVVRYTRYKVCGPLDGLAEHMMVGFVRLHALTEQSLSNLGHWAGHAM